VIKNFTIYGERCSGTNFLQALISGESFFYDNAKAHLGGAFRKQRPAAFDLSITWDFGHKHFFGFNDEDIANNGDETLFLGIVRNPYNWMNSLFETKHNLPQQNFSVQNFLFGEWYSIDHDNFSDTFLQEYLEDRNLYTGERYKNIFELRKIKLDYLHNRMPKIAKNYMLIRYEDLCYNPIKFVEAISERFNLKISSHEYLKSNPRIAHHPLNEYEDQITEHLDWDIEKELGYTHDATDIIEFYKYNYIDPNFDHNFYAKLYPDTKDYYQPFCEQYGIGDAHRLFHHYKTYGIYTQAKINLSCVPRKTDQIIVDNIPKGSIDDIIPVHNDFVESYNQKVESGKKIAKESKIVVVSLARDCAWQLQNSIDTINKIESKQLNAFIYENDSKDHTAHILEQNSESNNNLEINCNFFNYEHFQDRSLTRTQRLANFRNICLDWVHQNHSDSDYVTVLDLDADLGFSLNGIYNSIYWLNSFKKASGMASYSLLLNRTGLVHYDSFAVRLNDWQASEELDHHNKWFRDWHPIVGSDPVPMYSCFGGLAVYKTDAFLSGKYGGDLGSEHVEFHKSMKENGWDMYLNPSSRFFSVFEVK